jgi:hypothetical protein
MVRRVLVGVVAAATVGLALSATPRSGAVARAASPPLDPTRYVLLTHGAIDPLTGSEHPPAGLAIAPAAARIWLVQLRSPLDAARQAAFAALHPTVLGYLPFDTYVVRADAVTATLYRARSDVVRAVLPLQPWEKVRDEVLRAPRGAPLRVLTWRDSPTPAVATRLASRGVPVARVAGSTSVLLSAAGPWLGRLAEDDGVAFVGLAAPMRLLNTQARWVTETAQRDDFHLSDPVGSRNGLGLRARSAGERQLLLLRLR